jgi:hypothetical protein
MDDDSVNGVRHLFEEAVNINNSWLYHAQNKNTHMQLEETNPFIEAEGQVVANVGYVYKIWRIDAKRRICIRSTIHSYIPLENYDQEADVNDIFNENSSKQYFNLILHRTQDKEFPEHVCIK